MRRIYLSPPHMGNEELEQVKEALNSNWIAPVGPHLDAFEREMADYLGVPHSLAVSSGTASIHLALKALGVGPGDQVICSSLTFVASANPILYEKASPVFIDSDRATWNMDPELLQEELDACATRGEIPKAVVLVQLYGQSANFDPISRACEKYGVPIIEDAAEALGARYRGRHVGGMGKLGALSFNGNKIITTSGGGMLVSHDEELIVKARYLSTQARDPAPHYQHTEIGYNYRMSNVLAAIGRGQLRVLDDHIFARRNNYEAYREALGNMPGIEFMPEASYGLSTRWLTCLTINPNEFGATREDVRLALEQENIEARPVWKPLHMQPVFSGCQMRGGAISQDLFERGLCLPSGSNLSDTDRERVIKVVRRQCQSTKEEELM